MNQSEKDTLLFQQLRNNDQQAYIELYRDYFPELARFILRNSGNRQDAEDMFQETLLVLVNKVRDENFQLQSELKTFLFSVNRNQWLKKLRSRRAQIPAELLHADEILIIEEDVQLPIQSSNWIERLFENITGHCITLITRIYLKQHEPENLIKELGYKNAHSFQNQKYKCINQLRKAGKKFTSPG